MMLANSEWADLYFAFTHFETGPVLTDKLGPMTVHLWVNDGLMAIFFLLVGLEIKRELIDGRLATWNQRRLPVLAAVAGMAAPALFYILIAGGDPLLVKGWAIPAATDIAFAMGVLALLGSRAPTSLKLFLVTVAIVDDMGAVAIIAVLSTVRQRYVEPERVADAPEPQLRAAGSTAERAIREAWPNLVPLQLVLRFTGPLLLVISFILFMRGHNAPGGGFIAALVASAAIGLIYLSTSQDRRIGPPRLPLYLIGGGVAFAILTGVLGLVAAGSFLEPLYGYVFGEHVSTSMLFDLGVFAAVVGLITVAFNLLGSAPRAVSGDSTGVRVYEAVEGALFTTPAAAPEQQAPRAKISATHVLDGVPPRELGR